MREPSRKVAEVALIVPVHNGADFIAEALKSALAQTRPPNEILVVNDGSGDATEQIVASFGDSVRILNQSKRGPAAARNAGVAATAGEYIAFLDADDIWERDKLESQLALLKANPQIGMVHCSVSYIDAVGTAISKPTYANSKPNVWRAMLGFNERYLVRCGSAPVLRRSSFEALHGFNTELSFAEDWELYTRLALHGEVAALREPLVRYRRHDTNLTGNYKTMVANFARAIETLYLCVPEGLQPLKHRAYGRSFLNVAWRAYYAGDFDEATRLYALALDSFPRLRFSRSGLRFALKRSFSFGTVG